MASAVTSSSSTHNYTTKYTKEIDVVTKIMHELSKGLLPLNGISMVSGDITRLTKPIEGLEEGQPYVKVGIQNEDETVIKAYLKSIGILKKDNVNYIDIEYNGTLCPLVIVKKISFKKLPAVIQPTTCEIL